MDAHILHVDAVDEHLAFLYVVVAGDEVHQRRLAAPALSHDGDGLALGNRQVDVSQDPLFPISERYIAEFYLMLETRQALGELWLLDGVLSHQYLVYAFHRCQTLGDVVACLREVFQGVDDGVEHHHVVDEDGTRECVVVEHQHAAEPEHDDNHDCAEELRHGVCRRLAYVHSHDVVAVGRVDAVEAAVHLALGAEGLDDAQAPESLLHLAHRVAPQGLGLDALGFQLAAHPAHEPAHDGHDDEGEERQLP